MVVSFSYPLFDLMIPRHQKTKYAKWQKIQIILSFCGAYSDCFLSVLSSWYLTLAS